MKTLITRVLSAIVAASAVVSIIYFFDDAGLKGLCYLVPILGGRELNRILFKAEDPSSLKMAFLILVTVLFVLMTQQPAFSAVFFAAISILFFCACVLMENRFSDLSDLVIFQAKATLGLLYVGVLPGMASLLVDFPHGKIWFLTLLAVVFAGDTFAYLSGMLWGKKKILPRISPKKTIVGSIGGFVGSATAGAISGWYFLPHLPLWGVILVTIAGGAVAQVGDFFESLLKRVANRKDSGSIMPGHGGVLDRLDGVLFAVPLIFSGALLLENLF